MADPADRPANLGGTAPMAVPRPDVPADPGAGSPPTNPFGPHYGHRVEEAAGGADSSPLENEPVGEQRDVARAAKAKGQSPAADPAG